ncbi:receptor-type adenylate cyclase [Trypanosoma conorhini]|uniref:Receptor-type adenylate cyclase n=1 Tax=Trypanosoma conorhini TaxID=83891 RepID=A0A422MPZ3_9TRYP|nr:receptor-type adenylate cyclase [Trypanosoma conorhini]RNE95267.1 receptor-type adenylate cyclase [Trypanosoma conorhini]
MAACWGRRGCCAHFGSRPSAASPCLLLLLVLLLLLLLPLPPHSAAAQAAAIPDTPVKILMLKRSELGVFTPMSIAFYAGLHASLRAHNSTASDDVRVEIVERETTLDDYVTVLEDVMEKEKDILAILGQFGDTSVRKVLPVLPRYDLVSFAPITGSSLVRGWNPNLYFVRADPAAELLALLRYAVMQLRVLRLGFMYLQGVLFGEEEYEQAHDVLSAMGYDFCGVFAVKTASSGEADPNEFDDAWERFAATRPQAVIVFGWPTADSNRFIKRMLTDRRTAGAYMLAPFLLQPFVLEHVARCRGWWCQVCARAGDHDGDEPAGEGRNVRRHPALSGGDAGLPEEQRAERLQGHGAFPQ